MGEPKQLQCSESGMKGGIVFFFNKLFLLICHKFAYILRIDWCVHMQQFQNGFAGRKHTTLINYEMFLKIRHLNATNKYKLQFIISFNFPITFFLFETIFAYEGMLVASIGLVSNPIHLLRNNKNEILDLFSFDVPTRDKHRRKIEND